MVLWLVFGEYLDKRNEARSSFYHALFFACPLFCLVVSVLVLLMILMHLLQFVRDTMDALQFWPRNLPVVYINRGAESAIQLILRQMSDIPRNFVIQICRWSAIFPIFESTDIEGHG